MVILDTQVEIPVYPASIGRTKARTLYSTTETPNVVVYEGRVTGWLGHPNTVVQSATMLMNDFLNLQLPSLESSVPDRPIDEDLSLRGKEVSNAVLTLNATEWTIKFHQAVPDGNGRSDVLSVANVSRGDGKSFVLDDAENSILTALRMFLSYQCGAWINTALIAGQPEDGLPWKAELGFVGRLSTPGYSDAHSWTASDYTTWPTMFSRYWKLFNNERRRAHLRNAIDHYLMSSAVVQNAQSATYGIVPVKSTLEALVRWWNGKPYDFEFGGGESNNFVDLLVKAIDCAELGRDAGCKIDIEKVKAVIRRGNHFRNTIDHGSAGRIANEEFKHIIALQLYLHNLARLLISAKLGLRDRHTRGSRYSPKFVKI